MAAISAIAISLIFFWHAIFGGASILLGGPLSYKMLALSGRPLSDDSYAQIITYEPNRLVLEIKTEHPAVLVVSEINYPGWVATIDGESLT